MKIRRENNKFVDARYVRHVRTLVSQGMGADNMDVDLYELADGTTIECMSPANDSRVIPVEVVFAEGHYPGFPRGA